MTGEEGQPERFASLHTEIRATLKSEDLHELPGGRSVAGLPPASYADDARTLRRALKQISGGSVENGLARLQGDWDARRWGGPGPRSLDPPLPPLSHSHTQTHMHAITLTSTISPLAPSPPHTHTRVRPCTGRWLVYWGSPQRL